MSPRSRLQITVETACERGGMCVHDRAGHGLGALQLRLALASPSGWIDAIVSRVDDTGWIDLESWSGGSTRVWHHAPVALAEGAPVTLHERYGVLDDGRRRLSVALS